MVDNPEDSFSCVNNQTTLNIGIRSPNCNHISVQCCIHANFVEIHPIPLEIWCSQASFGLNLTFNVQNIPSVVNV